MSFFYHTQLFQKLFPSGKNYKMTKRKVKKKVEKVKKKNS